jgi:hypothetical protein
MTLHDAANDYEASTLEFLRVVDLITDQNLDRHVEGGWSARQIVHHVADSETQSYARLRRLLAEPEGSSIQGYDEAAWAENSTLGYRELPIKQSVVVFIAVRSSTLDILRRLEPADLERFGVHSESGPYSVATWLDVYTRHPREHAAQLLEAINA